MHDYPGVARARAWLLGLLLVAGGAWGDSGEWVAGNAVLELRPNHALLAERGLSLRVAGELPAEAIRLHLPGTLGYERWQGSLSAMRESRWQGARELGFAYAGRTHVLRAWRLRPAADRLTLNVVDAAGNVWLHLDHVHFDLIRSERQFALEDMDVRVGPALSAWAGGKLEVGLPIAAARLEAPVRKAGGSGKIAKSCQSPNWPNQGGFVGDVALTRIDSLAAQCSGQCNGQGASAQALVKITPSVELKNVGTADVPWYEKFVTSPYPYPYVGNDQHPFLVWNVYRQGADGRLVQIARSGLKHAFSTQNTGTSCNCGNIHNILGPNCEDVYGTFTNDDRRNLSPRAEVIAFTGQWGRCFSIFDTNCDGAKNDTSTTPFELRANVPEAMLVPTIPASSYFIEAWYVVRDDVNIYNGMGHRPFLPSWNGAAWLVPMTAPQISGPVIDTWVNPAAPPPGQASTERATGEGRLKLAVRTQSLPDGKWRYTYALMNFDFSRATTSGAEPNLQVLSNPGIAGLRIPFDPDGGISGVDFDDGDTTEADWTAVAGADAVVWTAPSGNSLDWGSMYTFGFVADGYPVAGTAELAPGGGGLPGSYEIATLLPGPSDALFADGLESP